MDSINGVQQTVSEALLAAKSTASTAKSTVCNALLSVAYWFCYIAWYGIQAACLLFTALAFAAFVYVVLYQRIVPQPIYSYPLHFHTVNPDSSELLGNPVDPLKGPKIADVFERAPAGSNSQPDVVCREKQLDAFGRLMQAFAFTRLVDGGAAMECTNTQDATQALPKGQYPVAVSDFLNPTVSQWTPAATADHELSRTSATKRRHFTSLFGRESILEHHAAAVSSGFEYELSMEIQYEYYPARNYGIHHSFPVIVDLLSVKAEKQSREGGSTASACDVSTEGICRVELGGDAATVLDEDAVLITSEQPQIGGGHRHLLLGRCQHQVHVELSLWSMLVRTVLGVVTGRDVRRTRLVCFEGFRESAQHPMRGVRVAIASPDVVVIQSDVVVYTKMQGMSYFLFHWFYTAAFLIIGCVSGVTFLCTIGCCVAARTVATGEVGFGIPVVGALAEPQFGVARKAGPVD